MSDEFQMYGTTFFIGLVVGALFASIGSFASVKSDCDKLGGTAFAGARYECHREELKSPPDCAKDAP